MIEEGDHQGDHQGAPWLEGAPEEVVGEGSPIAASLKSFQRFDKRLLIYYVGVFVYLLQVQYAMNLGHVRLVLKLAYD